VISAQERLTISLDPATVLMVPGGVMADPIELYLTKHVNSAVDLYLLVSDLLEDGTAPGATYLRTGSGEDKRAVTLRLRRLVERIRLGSEECCLYSTPLRVRDTRS